MTSITWHTRLRMDVLASPRMQYYFDAEGRRFRSQKEAVAVLATTLNMPGFGEADSDYDGTGDPRRKRAKVDGAVVAAGKGSRWA